MIKFENTMVAGFEPALRGMRNPKKSWDKSDSKYWSKDAPCGNISFNDTPAKIYYHFGWDGYAVGANDQELAMKLVKAGSEHAKFRRMIAVWVDITAPRYFWTEFDTYKVGTVSNSESTMHTIHQKPIDRDDFSHEKCDESIINSMFFDDVVTALNRVRDDYLATHDKDVWYGMIQLLPQSYNQKRTVFLNYEVLANMYRQRKNHKLDEWRTLCDWIEKLPYSEFITGESNG